jgi:hypothetical protein
MEIQIDSREKIHAVKEIKKEFSKQGINYFTSKLYVGDYMSLDDARLVIDRKQDLGELCGNVCQQHKRFKEELVKAINVGIQLIILVEHGEGIESIEDVYFWKNPRKHEAQWKTVDGKRVKTVRSEKAVDGEQLYKSLCTMRDRYNIRFEFCTKEETGKRIIELLGGELVDE